MNYKTMNPVPSVDPRDLDDNAQALDQLLNSDSATAPDRLGVLRKTYAQMERDSDALFSQNLVSFANLNGTADRLPYFTGAGALGLAVLTAAARTLLAAANQADQRTALGLGTASTRAAGVAGGVATLGADGLLPVSQLPPLAINSTFTVASQAAMLALTAERGDVAIRTDLNGAAYILTADAPTVLANWVPIQQNLGTALTALGALSPAADRLPYFTGASTAAVAPLTAFARSLLDDPDAITARETLGVNQLSDKPAWIGYTPTVTATSGSFTSVSATGRYQVLFGVCFVQITVTITTLGTGTYPLVSLPVAALAGSVGFILPTRGNPSANQGGARIVSDLLRVGPARYDNQDLAASGETLYISGSYPVA